MAKFTTTPDSDDNRPSPREWTAVPTEPKRTVSSGSSQQSFLSISSSIYMDPSSASSLSEPEDDFDVNIEQLATTLELWDTGIVTMGAIVLTAATFITLTLLFFIILGSSYIAINIWNWFFPPTTASSERLRGYQEGFSKATEKATEAIANLTVP